MASKVHHVRFYGPAPFKAQCLALHPDGERLALSRTEGSDDRGIEIWELRGAPVVSRVIAGTPSGSIEAMCWFGERLFSTGLGGAVVEWDLSKLAPKKSIPLTGEAAWCLDVAASTRKLAVGTERGYVNVLSTADDRLAHERIFDKQEGRILCCAFGPRGELLATGSNEAIRVWDAATGQALRRMTLGRAEKHKETIVWCLAVAPDSTIVSGDSRGHLTFWDARLGEQIESVRTHRADVLAACVSDDGRTVTCAGVDPLIVSYAKVRMKRKGEVTPVEKWVKSAQRNIHQHDVRALAMVGNKLYSCGIDGYLAVSSFPPKVLVKYPSIHPQTAVSFLCEAKLACLRYTNSIEIWRLGSASADKKARAPFPDDAEIQEHETISMQTNGGEKETDPADTLDIDAGRRLGLEVGPKMLLRLTGPSGAPIVCYAMSRNQNWIAYSTDTRFRIFKLSFIDDSPTISRLMPLPDECVPCYRMCFSPDSNSLITSTADAEITIFHIHSDGAVTVDCRIATENVLTNRTLAHLVISDRVSPNSYYLSASDTLSNIGIWQITRNRDTSNAHFVTQLPRYNYFPSAITFNIRESTILVAYTDQKLVEYDLKNLCFTKWSRRAGEEATLGARWWSRMFPVSGLAVHPEHSNVVMAYDDNGIYVVNKNYEPEGKHQSKKSKKSSSPIKEVKINCVMKKYKHLVGAGWLQNVNKEIEAAVVIVEPSSLLEKLPPAFFKKSFGCM